MSQKCTRRRKMKLLAFFKVRKNTGIILRTCIQCGEMFKCDYKCSLNADLQKHIKAVHDKIKDFECTYPKCVKCSTNSHLQQHIKSVHDKIRDFECPYPDCDYKCSVNAGLQRHINAVHDGIQDFECPPRLRL